jgi:hypothetical protein
MRTIRALAVMAAMAAGMAAQAADKTPDWIMDTSDVGTDRNGVIQSHRAMELGIGSPGAMQLMGEETLRSGSLDAALRSLQKAVEMAPGDMDKRTLYAQALQKKLMKQDKKDPAFYNFVVKQWFYVYKHAEYIDQTIEAKQQLKQLCGTVPKPLERSRNYLGRVLLPEEKGTSVARELSSPPDD